jgi:hypothetical protein
MNAPWSSGSQKGKEKTLYVRTLLPKLACVELNFISLNISIAVFCDIPVCLLLSLLCSC